MKKLWVEGEARCPAALPFSRGTGGCAVAATGAGLERSGQSSSGSNVGPEKIQLVFI